jgi:hypothetical protein
LVDDEDEDPDFSPGDAEDEETGEGEEAGSSEGEISDTNAPYAEAEAAQPAGRSRRGKQQTHCDSAKTALLVALDPGASVNAIMTPQAPLCGTLFVDPPAVVT